MLGKFPIQQPPSARKRKRTVQSLLDRYPFASILAALVAAFAAFISGQNTDPPEIGAALFTISLLFFVVCIFFCLFDMVIRWLIVSHTEQAHYRLSINQGIGAILLSGAGAFFTHDLSIRLVCVFLLLCAFVMVVYEIMTYDKKPDEDTVEFANVEIPERNFRPRDQRLGSPAPQPRQPALPESGRTIREPMGPRGMTSHPEQLDIERREVVPAEALPPLFLHDPLYQFPKSKRARIFVEVKGNDDLFHCEDAYAIAAGEKRFALCDGTSLSNLPRPWAALLAQQWVGQPIFQISAEKLAQWLEGPRQQWEAWVLQSWLPAINQRNQLQHYPPIARDQVQQIMQQGAAATLLGLILNDEKREWVATALGDTCLFIVRTTEQGMQIIHSFPYHSVDEFTDTPWLFSSHAHFNVQKAAENIRVEKGSYQPGDIFLLATDALAAWILLQREQGSSEWRHLLSYTTEQEFAAFVEEQRGSGYLNDDDTSLIIVPTTPLQDREAENTVRRAR